MLSEATFRLLLVSRFNMTFSYQPRSVTPDTWLCRFTCISKRWYDNLSETNSCWCWRADETVPGSTNDSACHGPSEENSQEKIDFHPASEPQRLTVAFPSTPGHSSITQAAEDQSNPPTAHSTDSKVSSTNKSPSRPSSSFRQGQDEHIGSVHSIAGSGTQGDAVVIATNIRSASFQSAQGEHYQHQGQQSVLNPASHSQSQFLLTISAPSSQSGQPLFFYEKITAW